MPQLPGDSSEQKSASATNSVRRFVKERRRRFSKAILKSHRLQSIRGYDFPIRIRPWFLLFTVLTMLLLAFIGFTNVARGVPINDKILHFFCLGFATGLFYWCFEPEEDARRIWYWRHMSLIITGVLCFFFGGIVSEFVQSLLPYKVFEGGDVLANLLGSSCGLAASWHLERYYRRRREISRLYAPLDVSPEDSLDEEDDSPELPIYHQNGGSSFSGAPRSPMTAGTPMSGIPSKPKSRLHDVWDSRDGEELFSVGDEDFD
ncbi:hypothetical protein DL93DRAFT_1725514 [Clavulina sp. PMI_390]|nr:hypothetical protein DL93DRAFT_1725514 [Clavulina sp. PMI_390]